MSRNLPKPPAACKSANYIAGTVCLKAGLALGAFLVFKPAIASEARPVTIDATVIVDTQGVVSGGVERGLILNSKTDVSVAFDGEAAGVPWLETFFDAAVFHDEGDGVANDLQGASNAAYARSVRLINAWASLGSGPVTLKAGLIDSNVDFDEQNVGALFVHSSHGMGPDLSLSGLNGPSVSPNTTLGAVATVSDAARGLKLRVGLFDGKANDPDRPARTTFDLGEGLLAIAEVDRTTERGRLALGAWHYTTTMPVIDSAEAGRGSSGAFIIAEHAVVARPDGFELSAWVRGGVASARYNPVTTYVGGGLVAKGFWSKFPEDSIGVAIAHAELNPRLGPDSGAETAIEMTVQHQLLPWLVIQPDVQFILNHGPLSEQADSVVVGLRLIALHSIL